MARTSSKELNIKSKVPCGKYKSTIVGDKLITDKKEILSLIKEGYTFTDEVLNEAKIVKRVTVVPHTYNRISEHQVDNKVYEKDTMSLKNILKSIHTIETSIVEENVKEETVSNNNTDDTEE